MMKECSAYGYDFESRVRWAGDHSEPKDTLWIEFEASELI